MEQVSFSLSIDHHLQFDKTAAGTMSMFAKERKSRRKWLEKAERLQCEYGSIASPMAMEELKSMNDEAYFEDEE